MMSFKSKYARAMYLLGMLGLIGDSGAQDRDRRFYVADQTAAVNRVCRPTTADEEAAKAVAAKKRLVRIERNIRNQASMDAGNAAIREAAK